ncbi:hypothetical protein Pmani_014372 [Petrolisthes manimaculis]|uniref:Ig-like domain-containing protein n=1 Tax=Petrolisthes manimaculis TaxID=1843537 RepID=A0AAE1PT15_9EUCA|nr:hypothetical protein Pmani_014372 [Petrolisthes manimaculis]
MHGTSLYEPSTGDWVLLIGSVQRRDGGVYECQISTTPPRSHFVSLHIIEPRTEILGGGDLHINTGSTINLTCLVLYHPHSPDVLTWLHQGKEIHYDSARGGVSVVTEAGEVTRSALLIQRATANDSGNYTCKPSGAEPATARVHILHELWVEFQRYEIMLWGTGGGCYEGHMTANGGRYAQLTAKMGLMVSVY